MQSGGSRSPGTATVPVGTLALNSSAALQGITRLKISRNGPVLTYDLVQVPGFLTYGGALVITNIGPTALGTGDRFRLFNVGAFTGNFTSVSLPPLPTGLTWTNKLLVDGSIEVVGPKRSGFKASFAPAPT